MHEQVNTLDIGFHRSWYYPQLKISLMPELGECTSAAVDTLLINIDHLERCCPESSKAEMQKESDCVSMFLRVGGRRGRETWCEASIKNIPDKLLLTKCQQEPHREPRLSPRNSDHILRRAAERRCRSRIQVKKHRKNHEFSFSETWNRLGRQTSLYEE